jgi:hypothetical protein
MQLRVAELKQELKQVREEAAADKKKLEDDLKEEQCKNQEADELLMTMSAGKAADAKLCNSTCATGSCI